MNIRLKHLLVTPLFVLMLFPWTKLADTFDSDVQPYSFIYGIGLLLVCFALFSIKNDWKMSAIEGYAALTSAFLLLESIAIFAISDGPDALRGVYQYINGSAFFMIIFFLYRYRESIPDSKLIYRLTSAGFFIWITIGAIQMTYDKSFLTSLVSRSVLTNDRGAISLSSEPGYFGYTLIFFVIFFALHGKKNLALLAALLIPILTVSAASVASLGLLFAILLTYRYGFRSLLILGALGFTAYHAGAFIAGQPELSGYRAAKLLQNFYSDKSVLILDGSLNIRLVHIYYSHYGFIENFGFPQGVTSWPTYLSEHIGEFAFLWDSGLDQTNRINSGMGGILFEGGWLSIAPIALVILLIREISTSTKQLLLYITIFLYLFYIGFNFRTPFLYILILGILFRTDQIVTESMQNERLIIKNKKDNNIQSTDTTQYSNKTPPTELQIIEPNSPQ